MTHILSSLMVASFAFAMTACTGTTPNADPALRAETASKVGQTPAVQTVKPGAALDFSHSFDGTPQVGAYSDVVISINHVYRTGDIRLLASGSENLDVLSASSRKVFSADTNEDTSNEWRVAVKPGHDGVHYLNIVGQVDAYGLSAIRTHAIRIDLGGDKIDDAGAGKPTLQDDGKERLAVFDAQETIIRTESD